MDSGTLETLRDRIKSASEVERWETFRLAARYLASRKIVNQRAQAAEINAHSKSILGEVGAFEIKDYTYSKVLRGTSATEYPGFLRVALDWLLEEQIEALQHALSEQSPQKAMTRAIHEFLNPSEAYPQARLDLLDGEYALIRPHFLDPEHFMLCQLSCSPKDASFECHMEFIDDGAKVRESAIGTITPFGDRFLCLGKLRGRKGPFIFILSELHFEQFDNTERACITRANGTIMVGAPPKLPNASPLILRKLDKPVPVGIYSSKQLADMFVFWAGSQRQFTRGYVEWRLSD